MTRFNVQVNTFHAKVPGENARGRVQYQLKFSPVWAEMGRGYYLLTRIGD